MTERRQPARPRPATSAFRASHRELADERRLSRRRPGSSNGSADRGAAVRRALRVVVPRRLLQACDRGSFTAEMAAGLPALMLLLFFGLTAVTAMTTKGRCVDAAREGALAAARGGPGAGEASRIAPDDAEVGLVQGSGIVTVTVRARVAVLGGHLPVITVDGSATAAREPEAIP